MEIVPGARSVQCSKLSNRHADTRADLPWAVHAVCLTAVPMTKTPHPPLTALSRARDDETFARLLRDGGRGLLNDPTGIGVVALAAMGAPGEITQAAARLLATAPDEARMAVEIDLPEGLALLTGWQRLWPNVRAGRPCRCPNGWRWRGPMPRQDW